MIFSIPVYLYCSFLPFEFRAPLPELVFGTFQKQKNTSVLILLTTGSKETHSPEQSASSVEIQTEIIQGDQEVDAFDCCQIYNKYNSHKSMFCFVIQEQWATIDQWLVKVINKMSHAPMSEWDFLVSNGDHLSYATNNGSIVIDKERSRRILLGASFNSMQKLCRRFKTNSQRWEYLSAGNHGFSVKTLSSILSNNPKIGLSYLLEASKYQKFKANKAAELINQKYFTSMAEELQKDKGINSKVFLCIFIS